MKATDVVRNSSSLIVRRRWLILLGITVVILIGTGLIHVIQVHHVKRLASGINVGDTRDQVIELLGKPRVTYSSGFPPQGGAASIWGSCYGGLLNSFQKPENWPVVIEFDKDGTVVEVKQ
jgi:hypothetical protein